MCPSFPEIGFGSLEANKVWMIFGCLERSPWTRATQLPKKPSNQNHVLKMIFTWEQQQETCCILSLFLGGDLRWFHVQKPKKTTNSVKHRWFFSTFAKARAGLWAQIKWPQKRSSWLMSKKGKRTGGVWGWLRSFVGWVGLVGLRVCFSSVWFWCVVYLLEVVCFWLGCFLCVLFRWVVLSGCFVFCICVCSVILDLLRGCFICCEFWFVFIPVVFVDCFGFCTSCCLSDFWGCSDCFCCLICCLFDCFCFWCVSFWPLGAELFCFSFGFCQVVLFGGSVFCVCVFELFFFAFFVPAVLFLVCCFFGFLLFLFVILVIFASCCFCLFVFVCFRLFFGCLICSMFDCFCFWCDFF